MTERAKYGAGDFLDDAAEDTGIRSRDLTTAIQVWSFLNWSAEKPITVRMAADAFRVADDVAMRATEDCYWMAIAGPDDDPTRQIIEHEGE